MPRVVATRDELRETLRGERPCFVPTMGSLHTGHLGLIERAAAENQITVVSVFVNPTQFGNPDDLAAYPRVLERDVALAAEAGADVIFAPAVEEMYPPGFATTVEVRNLSRCWEGASRPGHFRGVATVVTVLLNLVQPARSYFGEKDYQQLQVIRRLHRDLALPGEIVGCATIRDDDGLALSSRNARLTATDRERALAIPRALERMVGSAAAGETNLARLQEEGLAVLNVPGVVVDYLAIVDGDTLEPLDVMHPGARLLIAAEVGGIRLIDNAAIGPERTGQVADRDG